MTATAAESSGTRMVGGGGRAWKPNIRFIGNVNPRVDGSGGILISGFPWKNGLQRFTSTGMKPTPTADGRGDGCQPRPNGRWPPAASHHRMAPASTLTREFIHGATSLQRLIEQTSTGEKW